MLILTFDTETSGLPTTRIINIDKTKEWPHIVQFSYLIYDTTSNVIVKIRDFIIKVPENVIISEESIKLHGITNKISNDTGVELQIALESFLDDVVKVDFVIGHNVSFDINMVKMELLRLIQESSEEKSTFYKDMFYEITHFTKFRCTLQETIDYCNILRQGKNGDMYKKFPSLTELYEKLYNKTPINLHNALNDVIITLICFMKYHYDVDVANDCNEIQHMLSNLQIV
jgi:DNA polymerase III epsilon subunit-like protein